MFRQEADFQAFERVMVEAQSANRFASFRIVPCRTIGNLRCHRRRRCRKRCVAAALQSTASSGCGEATAKLPIELSRRSPPMRYSRAHEPLSVVPQASVGLPNVLSQECYRESSLGRCVVGTVAKSQNSFAFFSEPLIVFSNHRTMLGEATVPGAVFRAGNRPDCCQMHRWRCCATAEPNATSTLRPCPALDE
jgi:hypothetical protein